MEYLTIIGERFPDRCATNEGPDDGHDAFGDWLMKELESCGYDPARIEGKRFCSTIESGETVEGRNIILTVPGQAEGQIIVGAHYDGDGLGDNGSGTALLLVKEAD